MLHLSQGTHASLKDNQKAKSTVGAIITATGSLGKPGCNHLVLKSMMTGYVTIIIPIMRI